MTIPAAGLWLALSLCVAAPGLAADVDAPAAPRWTETGRDAAGLSVSLQVPRPELRETELLGETFTEISVPGGEIAGEPGQPELPVLSRFVAVPPGRTLRLGGQQALPRRLDGSWRPAPAQPLAAAGAQPVWDRAWYAAKTATETAPLVEIGQPAIMHGVRVVPITVHPVAWDRATGAVTWTPEVELAFDLVPSTDDAVPARPDRPLPESFAKLLEQNVLGFDKGASTTVPLGTWVCIFPNDTAVITALEPLAAWRARQGYNVIMASTSETGATNTAIKAYLQNLYNTLSIPLEMVCLAGDADGSVPVAAWRESLSGYNGEGDHPYTQLDGTDVLSDVHVGRLATASATELTGIVNKIVNYESNPWLTSDTGWFSRAGLTGDPSTSGYSCIWTNQWVKDQLLKLNYATIDTIWTPNFVTKMSTTINAGESIFTYRGYYGMSGFNTGYIGALTNAQKLPFAIIMTCGTGSFWGATANSEAFLRNLNGGGVAAIGTATTGTHTRYNNCIFAGTCGGVLNLADQRTGPALTAGKLAMYVNYYANEPEEVTIWSTWNNLMGDPATRIWSARPRDLTVTAPATLDASSVAMPVTVTAAGVPVEGALVTVYRKGVLSVCGETGADGRIVLPLSGLVDGSLQLTVTGRNLRPYLGAVAIGPQVVALTPGGFVVDDDMSGASQGDGDGAAEPGETIELTSSLTNHGSGLATEVQAHVASSNGLIAVATANAAYGAIASGATGAPAQPFVVAVDAGVAGGTEIPFEMTITTTTTTGTALAPLTVHGPAAELTGTLLGGVGGALNPGQTGTLRITVRNSGDRTTAGAAVVLSSTDHWVSVVDGDGTLPAMAAGALGNNAGDLFTIEVLADCLPGHLAVLDADITFAEGGKAHVSVPLTFGTRLVTDPVGPDAGRYYAFDNGDTGHAEAPIYDWIEIDPALGGAGTSVGLTDLAIYADDTRVLDLPFVFRYYGREFSKISVCSNGWIAMGATNQRHYRNRSLPAIEAPDDMICAYWDELYLVANDGGVFCWHDVANHRYVIEWRRLRNEVGSALETFEIVLSDPSYLAGDTGDGIILVQYQTVNQVDSLEAYSTVGIQSLSEGGALQYSYWNAYAGGAAPLQAGRAIAFRTVAAQPTGQISGTVTNSSAGGSPVTGATVTVLQSGRQTATVSGQYQRAVPVGTWNVAVSHPSFAPDTTYGVVINEGTVTTVDFSLADIAGPAFAGTTIPDPDGATGSPYEVTTTVTDVSGIAALHFYYTSSSSGGPFEIPLQPGGTPDQYVASIPEQAQGTRVQYWLGGTDPVGNATTEPAGGPFAPYEFVVTTVTEVTADMETDAGWVSGAAGDNATAGLWTRVDPNAIYNDGVQVTPEDDHTAAGTLCWITGQDPVGGTQGGNDVDGGTTTLVSPVFSIAGFSGVELRYWRWYTNDTGVNPGGDTWTVQASIDGGTWLNLENTNASQRSWIEKLTLLEELAPALGSQVQLRFIASDLGSGSLVEAGVDDFRLRGFGPMPTEALPPTVALGYPVGGESVPAGAPVAVTWTHGDDIGVVEARLWLSTDGGTNWTALAQGPFNQTWSWTPAPGLGQHCRLRVEVLDAAGHLTLSESAADFAVGGAAAVDGTVPTRALTLAQPTPNPFNPRTKISFVLAQPGEIELCVYDVNGRLVRTLVSGWQAAGERTVVWDGDDDRGGRAASGVYFCRLSAQDQQLVRKMTLLK